MGRTSDARERIVDAAIELIWPASYAAVGVDAICERAGVKKGSFYHFFPSKDELVIAAIETHWERRRPVFDGIFSASKPPLDRLRDYFAWVHHRQVEVKATYGRVLGCFYNCMGSQCIQSIPAISAKVQEIQAQYRRYLEATIRDAQASGDLRAGDPQVDARVLFTYVEGSLGQARLNDDTDVLRGLPETAFALLGQTPSRAAPKKPSKVARA